MKKVEELCIKYLMNETDPAETADIRAEMIDDPDALIEYESLRSTWTKIQGIPEIDPPPFLTEAVINSASEVRRSSGSLNLGKGIKWAAAAAVLIMVGAGVWTSSIIIHNYTAAASSQASSGINHDKQWIDRNDVLYIQPGPTGSVTSANASKLKPVTPTAGTTPGSTEIQLAGSRKPAN